MSETEPLTARAAAPPAVSHPAITESAIDGGSAAGTPATRSDGARVETGDEVADSAHEPQPATPPAAPGGAPASTDGGTGLENVWTQLQLALHKRLQPEQFETWFRRANLVAVEDERVVVAVQNDFTAGWLRKYYTPVLESAVLAVLGVKRRAEILVDPELILPAPEAPEEAPTKDPSEGAEGSAAEKPAAAVATPGGVVQRLASSPAPPDSGLLWNSDIVLNAKYTFENFVVGPCNRFGHAAAMGAGESPGKTYNPFFLHGHVGVGKTHLLQAVCFSILERWPASRILYLSCETFVNHFISALENGDLTEFRNKYRNVDVLVVDDIHLLANKERTQEEFFHTFNTLYNAGKQIVLSSDSPPLDIPTLQERLVSRFKWGMVTEIEPPCYETRMAIVKRKSRERGCEIPDDVSQLIAEHVTRNVRELEGAVTRLLGYASLTDKPISFTLAREALQDIFRVHRGLPNMNDIITAVIERYGVKLSDLQSKRRTNSIAYPRQVAMYLARKITNHSLEEIGGYFGGRDHSTVLHAVNKITNLVQQEESACRAEVDGLLELFQGPGRAR